jgi:hypothetical protein
MKEGRPWSRILQSYVLFWVIMLYFELLCNDNGNPMEGFETGVQCILPLIDIF